MHLCWFYLSLADASLLQKFLSAKFWHNNLVMGFLPKNAHIAPLVFLKYCNRMFLLFSQRDWWRNIFWFFSLFLVLTFLWQNCFRKNRWSLFYCETLSLLFLKLQEFSVDYPYETFERFIFFPRRKVNLFLFLFMKGEIGEVFCWLPVSFFIKDYKG